MYHVCTCMHIHIHVYMPVYVHARVYSNSCSRNYRQKKASCLIHTLGEMAHAKLRVLWACTRVYWCMSMSNGRLILGPLTHSISPYRTHTLFLVHTAYLSTYYTQTRWMLVHANTHAHLHSHSCSIVALYISPPPSGPQDAYAAEIWIGFHLHLSLPCPPPQCQYHLLGWENQIDENWFDLDFCTMARVFDPGGGGGQN